MTVVKGSGFCEVCKLPLFLLEADDAFVCKNCFDKLMVELSYLDGNPCGYCGRRHTYKFLCGWCHEWTCDGCVYREHEWSGNCHYPYDD